MPKLKNFVLLMLTTDENVCAEKQYLQHADRYLLLFIGRKFNFLIDK